MNSMKLWGIVLLIFVLILAGTNIYTWWSTTDKWEKDLTAAVKAKDNEWRLKLATAPQETTGTMTIILPVDNPRRDTVPGTPGTITPVDSAKVKELISKNDSLQKVIWHLASPWSWVYEDPLRKIWGLSNPVNRTNELKVQDKDRKVEVPVITRTVLQTDTVAPDRTKWYWNDGSINADFVWSGWLEAGISYSFWTWSAGGKDPNAIIMRLPEIGVSANFNNKASVFIGARINLGHYLPGFQDLYLSGKYGYDFYGKNWEPRIGLGTGI